MGRLLRCLFPEALRDPRSSPPPTLAIKRSKDEPSTRQAPAPCQDCQAGRLCSVRWKGERRIVWERLTGRNGNGPGLGLVLLTEALVSYASALVEIFRTRPQPALSVASLAAVQWRRSHARRTQRRAGDTGTPVTSSTATETAETAPETQELVSESLEYLEADEADGESEKSAELARSSSEAQTLVKQGKVRNAHLVEPPMPEGIRAYTPGEGYGSNAIPFAGVSPKTSKRRNEGNRMKAIEMLERAKEVSDRKKEELATRRSRAPSQTVPVPRDVFAELQEKGWLEALGASGLYVDVEEPGAEPHHARWIQLSISGDEEEQVRAGVLRLMSLMVPRRMGSGSA
ncbi:CKMT2 [Symbiodinium sp. CCMP2456]|nr:CKMT2 [Symbiodinium sp. CCMP2456]